MSDQSQWLQDIIRDPDREWLEVNPWSAETMLAPGLPCRATVGGNEGQPVIYLSIGHNGTAHYWQWASLDQETWKPLPRKAALGNTRRFIRLVLDRIRSEIVPELLMPEA